MANLPGDIWRKIAHELLSPRERQRLCITCKALMMYIKPIPRPPRRPASWFDHLCLRPAALICWVCLRNEFPLRGINNKGRFSHGICKSCSHWAREHVRWVEPGTQYEWRNWVVHLTNLYWKWYGYPEELRVFVAVVQQP